MGGRDLGLPDRGLAARRRRRGHRIWHRFSHTPGLVHGGETGDVACDHYRRFREDVALMKEPRPDGLPLLDRVGPGASRKGPAGSTRRASTSTGGWSTRSREAGIEPAATLYHWDLPAALDDRGGWLNRDVAAWFAEYASVAFRALDGRVRMWATLNEPWVVTDGGYLHGGLAPGHRNLFEAPIVTHNLMRAHGAAVDAYRAEGRHAIGLVVNLEPKYPASDSEADLAATRRADAYMNRQFLDTALLGRYPEELPGHLRRGLAAGFRKRTSTRSGGRSTSSGINYYTRGVMRHDPKAWPLSASRVRQPGTHTEMEWEVYPDGLTDVLVGVRDRYGAMPLYVTENGAAFADPPLPSDGLVPDPARVDYLREHLRAARRALGRGRGPARLLRVVASRQLRVVPRDVQALRPRARRLRHAAPHAQGERALLLRRHPHARGRARRRLSFRRRRGRAGGPRRRSGGHGDEAAVERGAVDLEPRRGAPLDRDLPGDAAPGPHHRRAVPAGRQAGIDAKAVPLRPHAEDPLGDARGGATAAEPVYQVQAPRPWCGESGPSTLPGRT